MLNPIENIIVPTDFPEVSDIAERGAVALAARDSAAIHLPRVTRRPFFHATYPPNVPEAIREDLRRDADQPMEEVRLKFTRLGATGVRELIGESLQPAEAVTKAAQDHDPDLVVMATHGHQGRKHTMIGSVAERTVRTSSAPVLSVKGYGISKAPIQRIFFATDFSLHSKQALSHTRAFAKRLGVHVDILHEPDETPAYIRAMSAEIADFEQEARTLAGEHLNAVGKQLPGQKFTIQTHLRSGRCDGFPARYSRHEQTRAEFSA